MSNWRNGLTIAATLAIFSATLVTAVQMAPVATIAQQSPDGNVAPTAALFLPIVNGLQPTPTPLPSPTLEPTPARTPSFGISQLEAIHLYRNQYLPAHTVDHGFTGDIATCNAGTLSDERLNALLNLINYYRQMAGVQTVTLDSSMSAKVQRAVLVLAAAREMSHDLDPAWPCYSSLASEGALRSNLGADGIGGCLEEDGEGNCIKDWLLSGIDSSMDDWHSNNTRVGHRNWLLNPLSRRMGIGEFLDRGWNVSGEFVNDPSVNYRGSRWPSTRHGILTWPPPGYVPYKVVFSRWSFHLQNGRFENAVVQVWLDGVPIDVRIVYAATDDNLAGPATHSPVLVFRPDIDLWELDKSIPHLVRVAISNVRIKNGGDGHYYEYEVMMFDPEQ